MSRRRELLDGVASRLGGVVDEVVLSALGTRFSRRRPPERTVRAPEAEDRRALVARAIAFYQAPETRASFLAAPAQVPRVHEESRSGLPGGRVVDLKWESGYRPAWEAVRADYLGHEPNRFAYARWLRHDQPPRAVIVCVHGYRGGAFFLEEQVFPTRWLYGLGLDVILFQLPFHGRRGVAGDGAPAPVWPSLNVPRTNEGFAQAVWDLRGLTSFYRQARATTATGSPQLVMCGMSLGGYTTALYATCEPLALAVPMIPVASFPDLLWAHGAGRPERARAEREGITVESLRQAMACHTPLLRAPVTPPERVLVMSAAGDRIAPPEHATRLAAHFRAEELRFTGGHVLQVGRGTAFRALARRMATLSLLPARA